MTRNVGSDSSRKEIERIKELSIQMAVKISFGVRMENDGSEEIVPIQNPHATLRAHKKPNNICT